MAPLGSTQQQSSSNRWKFTSKSRASYTTSPHKHHQSSSSLVFGPSNSTITPTSSSSSSSSSSSRGPSADSAPASHDYSRYVVGFLVLTNALLVFFQQTSTLWPDADLDPRLPDVGLGWTAEISPDGNSSKGGGVAAAAAAADAQDLDTLMQIEDIEKFAVRIRRRHVSKGHGLQGFVLYSSYRTGTASFVLLGLSPLAFHSMQRSNSCRWQPSIHTTNSSSPSPPSSAPIVGSVAIHFPGESFRMQYEAMIIICSLQSDASQGGQLFVEIDRMDVLALTEEGSGEPFSQPVRHNVSLCSPPLHQPLHTDRMQQWIAYHRWLHDVSYFVLYDAGGVDKATREALGPLVAEGVVELRDISDATQYDSYHFSQLLAINDCLYRTRLSSHWTLFLDFDEFISFPPPKGPMSLLYFLQVRGNGSWPWVSFGRMVFNTHHCKQQPNISDGDEFTIERLIFRDPEPYCRNTQLYKNRDRCNNAEGQRKYVVNPRRIVANQINRVLSGDRGGYNAPTHAVRVNYFRGLAERSRAICDFSWPEGKQQPDRLVRDATLAALAEGVRRNITGGAFAQGR